MFYLWRGATGSECHAVHASGGVASVTCKIQHLTAITPRRLTTRPVIECWYGVVCVWSTMRTNTAIPVGGNTSQLQLCKQAIPTYHIDAHTPITQLLAA